MTFKNSFERSLYKNLITLEDSNNLLLSSSTISLIDVVKHIALGEILPLGTSMH